MFMTTAKVTSSKSSTLRELLTEMKDQEDTESIKLPSSQFSSECWFDDACILDMDYFVKTLAGIKAKGVHADLIGSIITHYASKWLPDISAEKCLTQFEESPESLKASWMKKRFFVETLVGVLPQEKDSIPCNFLLRLLRTANMVGVEASYRMELEQRISWQLDQASLKELVIPSFSHTCGTLLDFELVIRLVKRFVSLESEGAIKSGASSLVKVAKLVDSYLAEAAVDANLSLSEFVTLAGAIPSHARATDDGLYRAIDTYLKAHPGVSKEERKGLCRLIDSRKLTLEASLRASQNERFPLRPVIQVLFSEQTKLHKKQDTYLLKRKINAQNTKMRKLKEEMYKLQSQCNAMQLQMEKMVLDRKNSKGLVFRLKRFRIMHGAFGSKGCGVEKIDEDVIDGGGVNGRQAPMDMKTRLVKGKNPHQ